VSGIELIAAERERQISAEGWTSAHDDEHTVGQLIVAAQDYIGAAKNILRKWDFPDKPFMGWPWDVSWWKPSPDPIRNLVKAGALIAAEIDRLERLK
jgi:hypothetical protein